MSIIVPRDYVTLVNVNGKEFAFSPANFYLANASLMKPKELEKAVEKRFDSEKLLFWDNNQFNDVSDLIQKIKSGIKKKHGSFKFWNNDPVIEYLIDYNIVRAAIITNKPRNRRYGKIGVPGNHHVHIFKKGLGFDIYSTTHDFSENKNKNYNFVDLKLSQLILKLFSDGEYFANDLMPFKIENIREGSTIDVLVKYYVENETKFEISRSLSGFPIYSNESGLKQSVIRQSKNETKTDDYESKIRKYLKEHGFKFKSNVIEFKNSSYETIAERFVNGNDSAVLANVDGIVVLVYKTNKLKYLGFKDDKTADDINKHPLTLLNQPLAMKDDYDKFLKNCEIYLPHSIPLGDLKQDYINKALELGCSQKIIEKIR